MKFHIDWLEQKHIDSINKDVKEIDATDENGNKVKFSIWPDFPNFTGIMNGGEIEGNLWEKPGTGKFTLYPPKTPRNANSSPTGGFKAGMKEMVKEKQEGIAKSQDRKEEGIKISSTMRMAVDIVVATLAKESIIDESVIKGQITKWRTWLWQEWDKPSDNPIYPN